jgi:glycosyltransferase involved in cell wall biosynthesis
MHAPLTVIIHTLNEEVNLPFTLRNVVGWADQIFVVDSQSTDRTLELARSFGVETVSRECSRESLVEQRNWALNNLPVTNDWVFILDADETMPEELKSEVARLVGESDPHRDGYWCRFRTIFLDRWIKHASMYPSWSLRLFRHKVVRYERREVNSHPLVEKGREGYLSHDLLHEDRRGFYYYVQRLNEFSSLEARAYRRALTSKDSHLLQGRLLGTPAERRRYLKGVFVRLPMRPAILFWYLYVVRRGFLDGRPGFDYCIYKAVAEWLVSVKMREEASTKSTHA